MSKVFYRDDNVMLIQGDCLEVMPKLKRKFDAIITDPPYGTTACKWDTVIPFDKMWECVNELIKDVGAICLFGSEPFSSLLRVSNLKQYKYDWVWNKRLAGNAILAKKQPLKIHELVHIFHSKVYIPQMTKGEYRNKMTSGIKRCELHSDSNSIPHEYTNDMYYPVSIQEFSMGGMRIGRLHPTQKPVALLEYLIKTYTNEGETVMDFTSGSGTTLIAALNTGRRAVGIEMDEKYCQITVERIKACYASMKADLNRK